jgi:hypothetical protein
MNTSPSRTPTEVPISPRHPDFDVADCLGRDWHGGDAFRTAFFNALSLTFPQGEKFFIDSIREFQPGITDPKLTREIRGFIGQEAIHSREHREMNEAICQARGYDAAFMEDRLRRETDWARKHLSPIQRLGATVVTEHLTAILGHALLTDPAWLDGADPRMAELWRWHAVEEVEHKSVAFDTYLAVGGSRAALRSMLRLETLQLARHVFAGMRMMLKANGMHRKPSLWWNGLKWLCGRDGILRKVAPEWRAFMRADFHPWDQDNRGLIEAWKAAVPAAA